jgi:hypothetical protein
MIRKIITNVVILLLFMQSIVFAQTDLNIEFYGTIQSANSTVIVINGQIVDVRGAQISVSLAAGLGVRVQATMLADGSIVARQVELVSAGVLPGIVEINGTVTQFTPPLLTISGQTIDTTGAEINGSIVIGQIVRVFAVATAPGVWQARFVDAVDNVPLPITTPEILPPVSTPEVRDDDDDGDSEDEDDDD